MLDAARIKLDFPILDQLIGDKPLIYLDSAATAQKPRAVLDALRTFYETDYANVHRGVHTLASRATNAYEGARAKVAGFVGTSSPGTIVFTRNATEAINLVAQTWARANLKAGDEILLSEMEHHSNLVPWHMLAHERGVVLKHIPLTDDFRLDMAAFVRLLGSRTKLVAISQMSNTLGTINPVQEITAAAHEHGALVLIDGAQSVPHMRVDVRALDVDFFAFSGHKMLGPSGIGALYAKAELLEAMPPFLGGGEMIAEVRLEDSTYNVAPHKFEAGTPCIAEAVGLGAAVDYLEELGMGEVEAYEESLAEYAVGRLKTVPGLRVLGPDTGRGGAVSFTLEGVHPHDLATIVDREGIAIRAGHHCTMPLHDKLGIAASARASFYIYNERSDADRLVDALEKARRIFGLAPSAV